MVDNGQLPAGSLVRLSTPGLLLSDAASSYELLLKAMGGNVGTAYANHAYRSLAEQESLFKQNYQRMWCEYAPGKVDQRTWKGASWYRKPGKPSTAVPGTSNHGWGVAVDFQGLGGYGGATFKRFSKLAPEYGWNNREGSGIDEAWHWVYVDKDNQHKGDIMQVTDKFTLSPWMQEQIPGDAKTMTVGTAYGYAAAGARTTANNTAALLANSALIVTNLAALIECQEELIEKMDALLLLVGKDGPTSVTPADVAAIAQASSEQVLANISLKQA